MPDRRAAAMLDCEAADKDANCKHCQASATGDRQPQPQRYWDIQLDQDLLETIVSIYPEWFKDYNMNVASDSTAPSPTTTTIDKNKESLKVKLMLRRPIHQLVDQGILPSLKSPPAFHEQKQKLERAKMGDLLKNKIQKRPDRQELIKQHILEDSTADPSLHAKQRQLKRARLADGLNDRLSQRPGPLELVKVNILHADEFFAQAVREGSLPFQRTCDTPSPSVKAERLDEDSGSDIAFSPSPPYEFNEHSQGSLPSLDASEPSPINPNQGSPCSGRLSLSPPHSVSSPLPLLVSPPPEHPAPPLCEYLGTPLHLPPKNGRKKTKPKTQPKTRTIKFHEYKGPPNAQKTVPSASSAATESSYDLLLQQQQLFLQWQLEWQQKYPQGVMQQTPNGDQAGPMVQQPQPQPQPQPQQPVGGTVSPPQQPLFESTPSPQKLLSKLEDLKVSDLKAELKKRNLPVSGSKPLLIERLKLYSELPPEAEASSVDVDVAELSDASSSTSFSNEDIVQLQQRCIEKLQKELERSQMQLQQSMVCPAEGGGETAAPPDKAAMTQRQIIHQYLQQKIQQQLQKQGTGSNGAAPPANATLTALLESRPMNAAPPQSAEDDLASLLDAPEETPAAKGIANRSSSLPSFSALLSCKPVPTRSNTDPQFLIARPPPDYNEATRQLNKVKQHPLKCQGDDNPRQSKKHKPSVKSQAVDDVLEILIKNGELPPSAAQDPAAAGAAAAPPKEQQQQQHLASLQSVLDMTPPSSAGLGSAPPSASSLDFDFQLELDAMDLDEIEAPGRPPETHFAMPFATPTKEEAPRPPPPPSQDRGGVDKVMDMDLMEWLEVLEETASPFQQPQPPSCYDPVFAPDDTFELFPGDALDFKPHSHDFLPWAEKTDFAT